MNREQQRRHEPKHTTDPKRAAPKPADVAPRRPEERTSDPRGGGFDSQRTYADADYGREGTPAAADVPERAYGKYADGSSDDFESGDASGYEGFREHGDLADTAESPIVAAPPEDVATEALPSGKRWLKRASKTAPTTKKDKPPPPRPSH